MLRGSTEPALKLHLDDVRRLGDGDAHDDEEGAEELELGDLAPQVELEKKLRQGLVI